MNQPSPNPVKAWTVTFAGTGINLAVGVLYTWSVIAAALVAEGWSGMATTLPYTIACLVFAALMIPGGRWLDKKGPRVVATTAGVLVGAGMVLSGITESVLLTTVGFGIIVGAGIGLGYCTPTPTSVKWHQPHKKGTIAGIVVAGFGLASVYIAPLTNFLINSYGVYNAFMILGGLFFAIIVTLAQFLSTPPPGYIPHGEPPKKQTEAKVAAAKDYSTREMIRTPQFYLLWICFCFASSAGLMIIGHLATISMVQGGIEWGFALVALLAIANAGGRVFFGIVGDKLGFVNTMKIVFTLQAINMFLFGIYTTGPMLLMGSLIAGAVYGSLLVLFPSTTFEFYGLKNAGFNFGIMFSAWGVSALIGPIMAARILDLTGGYGTAFTISGILLVIALVLTFFIKRPEVQQSADIAPAQ